MILAVHERLNDLQSIYLDDLEIFARAIAAAIGTSKGKADKSGSHPLITIAAAIEARNALLPWKLTMPTVNG